MKTAVGIGASSVGVQLDAGAYAWDDTIRGTVTIQGGETDQVAKEVHVRIRQHSVTAGGEGGSQDNYFFYADTVIAWDVLIAAHSTQQLDFQLPVPGEVRICPIYDYAVMARLAISGAADREGGWTF